MGEITNIVRVTSDLERGVVLTRLGRLFAQADKEAHELQVEVVRRGEAVDLTGATATAYFIRADDATVILTGQVRENLVSVRLSSACYEIPGRFQIIIKAATATGTTAVFWADGFITETTTDSLVDPEHIVPSLAELLARLETMAAATSAATRAAGAAESAAANAEGKAALAGEKAALASEKAALADGKAALAQEAATAADAAAKQVTDQLVPELTIGTVTTLEAGSPAEASITGTVKNPRLNLGIPKGADGGGSGQEYVLPTASGSVKGGVRVGDGLAMQGEVLSVPVMTAPSVDEGFNETDGRRGLVPDVPYADQEKFLRGDGTWQDPVGTIFVTRSKAATTDTAIEAGTDGTLTAAADTVPGYTPVGVVSFQMSGTGSSWCTLFRVSFASGTATVGIRNQHASKAFSPNCVVTILYLKG